MPPAWSQNAGMTFAPSTRHQSAPVMPQPPTSMASNRSASTVSQGIAASSYFMPSPSLTTSLNGPTVNTMHNTGSIESFRLQSAPVMPPTAMAPSRSVSTAHQEMTASYYPVPPPHSDTFLRAAAIAGSQSFMGNTLQNTGSSQSFRGQDSSGGMNNSITASTPPSAPGPYQGFGSFRAPALVESSSSHSFVPAVIPFGSQASTFSASPLTEQNVTGLPSTGCQQSALPFNTQPWTALQSVWLNPSTTPSSANPSANKAVSFDPIRQVPTPVFGHPGILRNPIVAPENERSTEKDANGMHEIPIFRGLHEIDGPKTNMYQPQIQAGCDDRRFARLKQELCSVPEPDLNKLEQGQESQDKNVASVRQSVENEFLELIEDVPIGGIVSSNASQQASKNPTASRFAVLLQQRLEKERTAMRKQVEEEFAQKASKPAQIADHPDIGSSALPSIHPSTNITNPKLSMDTSKLEAEFTKRFEGLRKEMTGEFEKYKKDMDTKLKNATEKFKTALTKHSPGRQQQLIADKDVPMQGPGLIENRRPGGNMQEKGLDSLELAQERFLQGLGKTAEGQTAYRQASGVGGAVDKITAPSGFPFPSATASGSPRNEKNSNGKRPSGYTVDAARNLRRKTSPTSKKPNGEHSAPARSTANPDRISQLQLEGQEQDRSSSDQYAATTKTKVMNPDSSFRPESKNADASSLTENIHPDRVRMVQGREKADRVRMVPGYEQDAMPTKGIHPDRAELQRKERAVSSLVQYDAVELQRKERAVSSLVQYDAVASPPAAQMTSKSMFYMAKAQHPVEGDRVHQILLRYGIVEMLQTPDVRRALAEIWPASAIPVHIYGNEQKNPLVDLVRDMWVETCESKGLRYVEGAFAETDRGRQRLRRDTQEFLLSLSEQQITSNPGSSS